MGGVYWSLLTLFVFFFQFCRKFRVGERCCEFVCLDPPGDEAFQQLERYRKKLAMQHNTTTPTLQIRNNYVIILSLLITVIYRFMYQMTP